VSFLDKVRIVKIVLLRFSKVNHFFLHFSSISFSCEQNSAKKNAKNVEIL